MAGRASHAFPVGLEGREWKNPWGVSTTGAQLFLMVCNYDADLGAFEPIYTVFAIAEDLRDVIDSLSWSSLGLSSRYCGVVSHRAVRFAPDGAPFLRADLFDLLCPPDG